ncbi:MAG: glycosyltransferase, partial [Nitrospinaceae bacterium]|nr:glycosyltransferase [Nitrospinaceae bacterium]NIR54848.1 glycosyltransferase [Nitrospinaceae bacterium]NIS85273.1 glycosyltransferase [Nitrospinaceae bacterium]NIT82086.1 glycosyltransferase [Nitrospinaceae bacterium]NIU44347.1 glycosyltransferase [Nitrospinaceae bacterium]
QNFFSLYKNLVHHYYFQHTRRDTFFFWTGCGAVRREAFSRVGGFDPALLSLEDIELGHRLRQAGGRVSLLPDLQCTHLKEWRFIDLIYTEIFCGALPWSRLMLSKTGMVNDLRVSFGERFRALLAGLWLGDVPAVVLGIVPGESLIVLSALVGFMNRNFWRYLSRRKGPGFALAALLYHQVYYLYSGAAFTGCWFEIRIYKKFFSQEKRSPAQDFQASGFPGLPSFRAKPRPEPNE